MCVSVYVSVCVYICVCMYVCVHMYIGMYLHQTISILLPPPPPHTIQGTDFCGTQGFDALLKRLKEGKKTCTDFEEFLEKWFDLVLISSVIVLTSCIILLEQGKVRG